MLTRNSCDHYSSYFIRNNVIFHLAEYRNKGLSTGLGSLEKMGWPACFSSAFSLKFQLISVMLIVAINKPVKQATKTHLLCICADINPHLDFDCLKWHISTSFCQQQCDFHRSHTFTGFHVLISINNEYCNPLVMVALHLSQTIQNHRIALLSLRR